MGGPARSTLRARDGCALALHDFGGPADGPVLLWAHANGFCALSYRPLLEQLARHARVLAIDLRGHGLSATVAAPVDVQFTPAQLAEDFATLHAHARERFPGARFIGAGHSLGALLPLALALDGQPLDALCLVEAAVYPPPGHPLRDEATTLTTEREARIPRRRAVFANADALCRALMALPAFAGWSRDHLMQHCVAVLKPAPDGSQALRCAPDVEGFLYGVVARFDQYNRLPDIAVPVGLLGADPTHPAATWVTRMQPHLHRAMSHSRLEVLSGTGHLAPLEAPLRTADAIARWIQS